MSANRQDARSLAGRLAWLSLFSAAFGFLEAAVVVYLRELFYPGGFAFPLVIPDQDGAAILAVELIRELATLLMLAGAAGLAACSAWGRFGAFAVAFGLWDLVFYAGLRAVLGWPASLATWDVLFLIPGIWTGPVWSAAFIAIFLVACGGAIMAADATGHRPRPRPVHWGAAALSLLLLLAAFLWNHGPVSQGQVPEWFPWPVWWAGVLVGLGAFGSLFPPGSWLRRARTSG